MTQFEFDEFWKSLNRLYLATEKLREGAEKTLKSVEKLQTIVENHEAISKRHESRLDKIEVVQQWLAEKERNREKDKE